MNAAEAWGQADGCARCSVLLISIDTLRADHLGCYGYRRATSPAIDRLAAQSLLFERAYSASYHTADAHMSMLTGVYPSVHRVRNAESPTPPSLHPEFVTLAQALARQGYATAGFHGGGNVAAAYGFDRGFASYVQVPGVEEAIAWLQTPERGRTPFLLFFHTYQVHDPYLPSAPFREFFNPGYRGNVLGDPVAFSQLLKTRSFSEQRALFWAQVNPRRPEDIAQVKALYDGEIREVDAQIERLVQAALALPDVLIVLTSDHGEEFYEHGRFRHDQPYDEVLHVPWLLRHPRHPEARRIAEPVSTVQLAPTLLDLLGLPPLPHAQGASLGPLLQAVLQGQPFEPQPILSEKLVGELAQAQVNFSLLYHDYKLIRRAGRPGYELYHLAEDPREKYDLTTAGEVGAGWRWLLDQLRVLVGRNQELLATLPRQPASAEALTTATREQLESLGYLGGGQ